jgi:cytidylate kinase
VRYPPAQANTLTPALPVSYLRLTVACTVVCISHAAGAGGEEVGRRVADRLGYLYVDEEIVARAAAKGGVDAADVADEERRKSFAARALNAIAQGGGEAWALGTTGPLTAWDELGSDDIRSLIRETIEQTAARGKAVIVSHAASYAIGPGNAVLRVLVTASPDTRAGRVAEAEGIDRAGAERALKESDAGRADYLKRFYDVRDESPTHYDLVLNTDALSVEQAADLISQAASA